MAIYGRSYARAHIGRFIGPFPSLPGPVGEALILRPRQPVRTTPRPHITPVVGTPPTVAPVAASFKVKAQQPPVPRTHTLVRPWIGPYPPLGQSRNLFVRGHQPPVPRPDTHVSPWIGPFPPLGQVSRNMFLRGHAAPVPRTRVITQRFTAYPVAAPPVSRNLKVFTRVKIPPTHCILNTVPIYKLPPPVLLGVYEVGGNMMANRLMRSLGFPDG